MALLYGRAGRLTIKNAGFRPGQSTAQLASGFFILRARDAAHYYMIEFP